MHFQIHEAGLKSHYIATGAADPHAVLLVPGIDNSGPWHWQTDWERLPLFSRVDMKNWAEPKLHEWVPGLDRAVRECPRPLVLVAHSLGCLAIAWWAMLSWSTAFEDKVKGALMVAPPDVDQEYSSPRLRDFRPVPQLRLPFPTIVVASRNDPYSSLARSREFARRWGSEFVDLGEAGHINADSGLGSWPEGLEMLASLSGQKAGRWMAAMNDIRPQA